MTTLQILVSRISQSAKIRDPAQESKVARKSTGLSDGDLQLDCPARSEQVYLPTNVDVTKGCQLSPPFNIFVPCSIIDLAPQERRMRPSPLPAPPRATLFDKLATGPLRAQGMRCLLLRANNSTVGNLCLPWGQRCRDHLDVLRRAQQTQPLHLQLFHWTACCCRAPSDSDEDTWR